MPSESLRWLDAQPLAVTVAVTVAVGDAGVVGVAGGWVCVWVGVGLDAGVLTATPVG